MVNLFIALWDGRKSFEKITKGSGSDTIAAPWITLSPTPPAPHTATLDPGATVTYRLTTTVSGSGQVQNLIVSDAIPAGTSYVPGSLKLDDAALTDASDSDPGSAGPDGISATIPSASGGTTRIISFDVKIN